MNPIPGSTRWTIAVLVAVHALLQLPQPCAGQQAFDPETVALDTARMNGYLVGQGARLSREAWQRIDSREKLDSQRERLHREFMFMIGLDPLPPRTPLELEVVRTVKRDGYTVEVTHFQSLPGFYVTANLYRPGGEGPFPALVWGPGHSSDRYGAKALRQKYAIPWVREGYVCLMIDPVQVAEVFGVHRGTHAWGDYDWFARGYTPIGIEVWNAMRGLDYLLGRSDVDPDRITINGVSGGGHLSWMAGAADPRFNVVQPVAGTADIATHLALDLQRRHCDCAYFINTFRHDWTTLAAIISPRPLLMHNSTGDAYYPPRGYTAVLEKAKQVYGWYGAQEKTGMFEVGGPHAYTDEECVQAVRWSNRWLRGGEGSPRILPFGEIPGSELAALGGQYARHPENINDRIQHLLVPRARPEPCDSRPAWERKKAGVLEKLRSVVFRNMPGPRWEVTHHGEHGAIALETEPGILAGMISYMPESMGRGKPAILYVAGDGDTEDMGIWNFMKAYPFQGYAASRHMVFPRGTGRGVWNRNLERKYRRNAMLLGRSLDGMRLFDVLCAVDRLFEDPELAVSGLTVAGRGRSGIIAAYAALLDPRIDRVILHSPTRSHEDGPFFLNILRYSDIDQSLAMLAPRELVLLGGEEIDFPCARQLYSLMGAEKKLRRCYTVAQALNLSE